MNPYKIAMIALTATIIIALIIISILASYNIIGHSVPPPPPVIEVDVSVPTTQWRPDQNYVFGNLVFFLGQPSTLDAKENGYAEWNRETLMHANLAAMRCLSYVRIDDRDIFQSKLVGDHFNFVQVHYPAELTRQQVMNSNFMPELIYYDQQSKQVQVRGFDLFYIGVALVTMKSILQGKVRREDAMTQYHANITAYSRYSQMVLWRNICNSSS